MYSGIFKLKIENIKIYSKVNCFILLSLSIEAYSVELIIIKNELEKYNMINFCK
jgi:hypothetical protein